jgi:hypothetical protein
MYLFQLIWLASEPWGLMIWYWLGYFSYGVDKIEKLESQEMK